jgi:hypothetical protein
LISKEPHKRKSMCYSAERTHQKTKRADFVQ